MITLSKEDVEGYRNIVTQSEDRFWFRVRREANSEVRNKVSDQVSAQVWFQVWVQVHQQVRVQFWWPSRESVK
jgi:hypothetical protein